MLTVSYLLVLYGVILLGLLFVMSQFLEFTLLLNTFIGFIVEEIPYLVTTFHGSHVIFGLCLLVVSYFYMYYYLINDFGLIGVIYWHFVDLVWLVVLGFVYDWLLLV